jgi:hypothetical protein
MATKNNSKTKYESNDFNIDSSLDLPDFDFDATDIKEDRNPVISAAKSAAQGVADSVFNTGVIRSTINKTLPKEYGSILNITDHTTDSIRSLYDTAAKEFKPAKNDLKRIAGRVAPAVEGVLGKKIADKLRAMSKSGESVGIDLSIERQRDDSLVMELGNIFKAQADVADQKEATDESREQFRDSIDQVRHRNEISQLDSIRVGIEQLTSYQDNVLSNYQKKSLELQFRQYFVTADLLEITKKSAAEQDTKLQGILKNTGLPEFVKINESERFSELARNKFYSDIRDSLFGEMDGTEYIKKFVNNVKKSLTANIQEWAQSASQITFMADMATGAISDGEGPSKAQLLGGVAGGLVGDYAVGKGQEKLKKLLEGNKELAKGAENVAYRVNNSAQLADDYMAEADWGGFEGLRQFLDDNRPQIMADTAMDADSLSEMHKPMPFSRAASKSIIEIIPGYLARIHQEIQILRTGNESIGLSAYDYNTNKFTTQKNLSKKIVNDLIVKDDGNGSNSVSEIKKRQNDILKIVDPEEKLTGTQRKAISDTLLRTSVTRRSTDAKHLSNKHFWRKAGSEADGIANVFAKMLETDKNGKRADTLPAIRNQNIISNAVRGLTKGIDDPRAKIQEMINTGQYSVLRDSGLIDDDNRISIDNLVKILSGDSDKVQTESDRALGTVKNKSVNIGKNVQRDKPVRAFSTTVSKVEAIARIDPEAFEPLSKAIYSLQDSFKVSSTLKPVETLVELVTSIDKRLSEGLAVYGDTTGRILTGDRNQPGWFSEKVKETRKKWSEISIGELGAKAKEVGAKGFTYVKDHMSKLASTAGNIAVKARDLVQTTLQRAADRMGDIYVGSELKPRLTRAKMLAGEYIDQATGKVLSSLDDIKGTVIDRDGNIILSIEDLKIAQLRGKTIEYLKDKIQGLGGLLAKAALQGSTMLGGLYGRMFSIGMVGLHKAKLLLPPFDVYVNGSMEKPLLYASQFKLGSYFSKKTGNVVKHPRDIDGPVLDKDGNIIVTEEQVNKGLVDRNGIAISNILGRGLNKVKELGLAGFSLIKKFGMSVKNFATDAFGALGEMVKGLFNGFSYFGEKYVEINKDQLDVQLEILKLLQERLPKKVTGDSDGDGVREGSVQDIINRRKEEKSKKEEKLSDKAKTTGTGGSSLYGAIAGLFKGKKKDEGEEGGKDSSLLSDAADAADIYDSVRSDKSGIPDSKDTVKGKGVGKVTARATTKVGRLLQGAKGLAGKAAGTIGKVGGTAVGAAASFFGLGSVLGKAGGALGKIATVGGSAIGKVGMGLGRLGLAALTSGGTIAVARAALMGLTGALFSPIGLAALGLTAAYYGYKYLTRKKLEVLNKVRYVQYGFNANDEDHFKAVFELEDSLEEHVKLDNGTASLDDKKIDLNELAEPFGIKATDKESVRKWAYWFNDRFKPIFLAHKSALRAIKPDLKIANVDGSKLTPQEKLNYLGATELPGANYSLTTSPFVDLERLSSDSRAVQAQIEIARTTIQQEVKTGSTSKNTVATATAMATLSASGLNKDGSVNNNNQLNTSNAKSLGLSSLVNGLNKRETIKDASNSISAQSTLSSDYLFTGDKGQMDALTVIRFKAYGLITMDAEKVKALRYLEVYVARRTNFSKDGAEYAQDVEALLEDVKVYFGISGARSPRGYKWITWFRSRFLPVFLNFSTAVEKATRKADVVQAERTLTSEQAVAVASAVYTTTSIYDGRKMSVWKITDCSPWDNYPLNGNDSSIELNLEALKEATKAVIRGEHKSDSIRQKTADNRNRAVNEGSTSDNKTRSELGSGAVVMYAKPTSITEKQRGESSVYGNNQPELLRQDGRNVRAVGEYLTGVKINHPGAGTGGDINSLPDPGTATGAEAIVPLLREVAKMTGVDPKILIDMCAIESKFDPQARPFDPRTGKYLSSAVGLLQFLKGTWADQLRANGSKYGIAIGTPPTDARANALMGAEFIKSNMNYLKSKVKRDLTETDVYLAHFLGAEGASKFLQMDRNTPAATTMPDEAQANPGVFFDKTGRTRTAGEIYEHFTKKISNQARDLGVTDSMFTEVQQSTNKKSKVQDSSQSTTAAVPVSNSVSGNQKSQATSSATLGTSSKTNMMSTPTVDSGTTTSSQPSKSNAVNAVKSIIDSPAKTSAVIKEQSSKLPTNAGIDSSNETVIETQSKKQEASAAQVIRKPEGFMGFQPRIRPSPQEIQAIELANRPNMEKGINDVNRTLLQSLGVHEESRDLLRRIVDNLSSVPVTNDVKAPATLPQAVQPRIPKEATKVPINMGRRG